ncbi:MAG: hypothetical protein CL609_03165 [Anaerolineaceae bacterium]|nr:hypothetical protein [Anaerolineaceae bacterium]
MKNTIPVNFHSHTMFSDGELTPEVLAGHLAAAGVRYTALTDHNSLEGLPRFQEALKKRNVVCISGLELSTQYRGREIHILGYGFDPETPELLATLLSLRQVHDLEVHSIAGSLRKLGANHAGYVNEIEAVSRAQDGVLDLEDGITLLHNAKGLAFLAHPLLYETDPDQLEILISELKERGLDGIEAIYSAYTEEETAMLTQLAEKYDLLVSAGTDFHAMNGLSVNSFAIQMPYEKWSLFRQALFNTANFSINASALQKRAVESKTNGVNKPSKPKHFRRRSYVLRIFLPTLIAITLFLASIWGIILPSFEETLMDRKHEMIRELTNSAYSILASYQRDEENGLFTKEEAQALAINRIESLRYGPEGKDYFWIQDLSPKMIMHPYRADLNGQDLSGFKDPRGVAIFVEFADMVRREGEGYIDYVWQWNDDPQRLEPKESYVKGFEPWGWVIGTGIYIDDVHQEITRLEQSLINTSFIISGAVVILLIFVLQQSLRVEHERQEVVDDLGESTERYHALIESTTEGTVLIVDDRFQYVNPVFLQMTGYTSQQLEFLELSDLLPREADNLPIWEHLNLISNDKIQTGKVFHGFLKQAGGQQLETVITVNPINFAGQRGFILLTKDVSAQSGLLAEQSIFHAAQTVPIGLFRASAARQGALLEMNPATEVFFSQYHESQPTLAQLFSDAAEFDSVMETLINKGEIRNHLIYWITETSTVRYISLSARLVTDEKSHARYIDGVLEDVTAAWKQKTAREALIEKLQASLLFLHEPINRLGRNVVVCNMFTTIQELTRLMTEQNVTASLVASENSAIIGIITDHDLRARVLAENIPLDSPIHTIMSSPLTKISENALIYEALNRMEERGVRHLAVEDQNGKIVNVIDNKSLIQFHRYGPIVLSREISRAETAEVVARHAALAPALAKTLLDSSLRPQHVTNMLAGICDAVTERLIQLAVAELGPPPAPFVFISMGSQGRQEQTLLTDQDNGIIYSPSEHMAPDQVQAYFLKLGAIVCRGLDKAGYTLCAGQVMANNPRWCRSLSDWEAAFVDWIQNPEPQEIINLSIFFDFRPVYGDTDLALDLRHFIHGVLKDETAFFHYFAQNAIQFKPPVRLLGNIYLSGGATEHAGEINLKDAMMPIVSYARLYALKHQLNQTHTVERIKALCERNIILPANRDEMIAAYDVLMQLRLQNQMSAIQAGLSPQNIIHPAKLGYIQQELLKQAFSQISAVQKKISYDFLGGI